MPHWDFKCVVCGFTEDIAFGSFDAMARATQVMNCRRPRPLGVGLCQGIMQRQASAPGSFAVRGFSEVNGYASPIDVTRRIGGMKVQIKGNPEILRDGTGR